MKTNDAEGGLLRFWAAEFSLKPIVLLNGSAGAGLAVQKDKPTVAVIESEPGLVPRQGAIGVCQGVFAVVIAARINHGRGLGGIEGLQRFKPIIVPFGKR